MSEENKTFELNDEELEKVSGGLLGDLEQVSGGGVGTKIFVCSNKHRCHFTSKSECPSYSDLFVCKYDN